MATIKNSRDVLLQAAADRLEDVELPGNVAVDFDNVIGATKPANNADVTQGAITSGVTVSGGGITLSGGGSIKGGQSGYDTGTGFFLGYTGGTYRFSLGNSGGNKVTWDGSTLSIVGDIVGSSNVNLGSGTFQVNGSTGYMTASNASISVAGFGNLWDPSQPCITATAFSSTTALAAIFTNPSSDSNAHGLRGRNTNYGTSGLVGVANASHAFYAESGTYGPFTGSHDAVLAIGTEIDPGDIVVDLQCVGRRGYSDTIFEVVRSSAAGQQGAAGVYVGNAGPLGDNQPAAMVEAVLETEAGPMPIMSGSYYDLADSHDYVIYNAVGEGQVNVCGQGGDLEPDDLIIASDMPGKGMRAPDRVARSNVIARCREAVTFSGPAEWRAVACSYMSR